MEIKGNRIRVTFENKGNFAIPEEYHYEFRNVILKKIQEHDPFLSAEMHDKWNKFFSFSGFLGKQWHTPLGLAFKRVEVVFVSPDASVIYAIKNAFLLSPTFNLFDAKIIVSSVKPVNLVLNDGIMNLTYETLGEIVIKKGEKSGKTLHVGIEDNIEEHLKNTIQNQYSSFSGLHKDLSLKVIGSKQKKKAIIKNGTISNSFIALRIRFTLKAESEIHLFLLTQGVGHHRKLGFGVVEISREVTS